MRISIGEVNISLARSCKNAVLYNQSLSQGKLTEIVVQVAKVLVTAAGLILSQNWCKKCQETLNHSISRQVKSNTTKPEKPMELQFCTPRTFENPLDSLLRCIFYLTPDMTLYDRQRSGPWGSLGTARQRQRHRVSRKGRS